MAHDSIQGVCDPAFQKLEEHFLRKFANGEELGAAINININGKDVVNIWAGYADEDKTNRWKTDTITNVYSSTKTVAAIAILLAHERGLLSVDDPVSKHWPEFAHNGKEAVLIRHVMSHTSGVSGWHQSITMEQVCDVPYSTARLAEQAP
jgi:CubicO group peptidase (beta-lactamase class C family)